MPVKLRQHITYANVVSTMCLFIVLGGGAYAATKIPKNAVGANQIRSNAVGSSEIKRSGVTSSDVKNSSLEAADFKAGQLPAGPKGDQGAPGARGANGATDIVTEESGPVGGVGVGGTLQTRNPTGWRVEYRDLPGGDTGSNSVARVVCAAP